MKLRSDGKVGWVEPDYRSEENTEDTIEIVLAEDDAEAREEE